MILEIAKRNSKGGRRAIKMSLLELHNDSVSTNKNGLNWQEEYVVKNLDSASMMPICCEFTDESKTVPLGHGYTGLDSTEGFPTFKDSEGVGCIEKAYPATVEINGEKKRVLCGEGYLFQQRYPNFVAWLTNSVSTGKVLSSIEITGTPENNGVIKYVDDDESPEFRTPKEFLFSGTAILSVEAADDAAEIIQINQKRKGGSMDEKTIALICDSVKAAVTETNARNSELEEKINLLTTQLSESASRIADLEAQLTTKSEECAALSAEVESVKSDKDSTIAEVNALKEAVKISALETALSAFSEDEKSLAKAEIEAFKAEPIKHEVNEVTDLIYREIGKKSREIGNSTKPAADRSIAADIFSEVMTASDSAEDTNIF